LFCVNPSTFSKKVFSKYITNVSSLQFFQLFRFGILFLINILLAKSQLSTDEIGIFEKVVFLTGAVSFFWVNGLVQSLYKNNKTFSSETGKTPLLFNALIISILLSVLTVVVLLSGEKTIAGFLIGTDQIPMKWIFVVIFLFGTPAFLIEYIYLLLGKPKAIIGYGISTFLMQLIAVSVPVYAGYGLEGGLYGLAFVAIIRFIWLVVLVYKHSIIKLSMPFIGEHLRISWPLIAGALISGAIPYVDGIIISSEFNDASFAIYRYGARELPLALLLANAFSNAMLPEFSGREGLENIVKDIKRKSTKLMHFLFPLSAILILTSKYIYPVVFNPSFLPGASVFNTFLLLVITRLIFPQTILMGLKMNRSLLLIAIFEFAVKVVLSLWLVVPFGMTGVALATVIAFFLERVVLVTSVAMKTGTPPGKYIDFKFLTIYSTVLIAIYLYVEASSFGF
jgi:hypothetical protein